MYIQCRSHFVKVRLRFTFGKKKCLVCTLLVALFQVKALKRGIRCKIPTVPAVESAT
jgi:hypothetical protein